MGKLIKILGFCVVIIITYSLLRPLPKLPGEIRYSPPSPHAVMFSWPGLFQAAVAAPGYGVLAIHGKQTPVPVASTIKLITALSILKKRPLAVGQQGPTITITRQDVAYFTKYLSLNGSSVPVYLGEQISEYQALQAMLLPSANNMAETLAVWAYGSMGAFLNQTNAYARAWGAINTHLADASGFSPKSVSTAQDLATLALQSLDNPVINRVVAQKSADLPSIGRVSNVNFLLGQDGILGIKTGNTDQAGGCFIFKAARKINNQNITVVGATVGLPNLAQAMAAGDSLANSALDNFGPVKITKASDTVGYYLPPWGSPVAVKAQTGLSIVSWKGAPQPPQVSLPDLASPAKPNQVVGRLELDNQAVNLITASQINKPSIWWRLSHPF